MRIEDKMLFAPLSLSLLGSSFIMVSNVIFKRIKDPFQNIITFIALSDWCFSAWWISTLIIGIETPNNCFVQAFGIQFFYLISLVYPLLLAARLFLANILERDVKNNWIFHVLAWGFGAVVCIYCTVTGVFGNENPYWCFINKDSFEISVGLALVAGIFFLELLLFGSVFYKLWTSQIGLTLVEKKNRSIAFRLCIYIVVPLLCKSWSFADRLVERQQGSSVYWLELANGLATASQGFVNSLVYGLDYELISKWKLLFRKNNSKAYRSSAIGVEGSPLFRRGDDEMGAPLDFDPEKLYDMEEENDDDSDGRRESEV